MGKNTTIQVYKSSKHVEVWAAAHTFQPLEVVSGLSVDDSLSPSSCPDQVSRGELQHVWRKWRTKPRRGSEEEDCHRGHLHAVSQPWGEQSLPGFLFLPFPSLWKPHEQTQERHRTGELKCLFGSDYRPTTCCIRQEFKFLLIFLFLCLSNATSLIDSVEINLSLKSF